MSTQTDISGQPPDEQNWVDDVSSKLHRIKVREADEKGRTRMTTVWVVLIEDSTFADGVICRDVTDEVEDSDYDESDLVEG